MSRVGGAAQIKAMKGAVGTLKGDLAQFRELEAFASMGSELDAVSQATLDRGYRLTELLKQGLNSPLAVEDQVVVLYAGTRGYLDPIPVGDVRRYETELIEFLQARHSGLMNQIKDEGKMDEDGLNAALAAFADEFSAEESYDAGKAAAAKADDAAPAAAEPTTESSEA